MGISYVTGDQYCVLLIPKYKAQQLNIANSNEVTIKTTEHGIVIEKTVAGAHNTSQKDETSSLSTCTLMVNHSNAQQR